MIAAQLATENELDTFERTLHRAFRRGGVEIGLVAASRLADRIPRFLDCSGPNEPLMLTRDALRTAMSNIGIVADERCCTEVAVAILPYISVLDSNLE